MTFDRVFQTAFSIILGIWLIDFLSEALLGFSPVDWVRRWLDRINP